MQRVRKQAGIPEEVKLFGLRHAFGARAVVSGVDINTLAELTIRRHCDHPFVLDEVIDSIDMQPSGPRNRAHDGCAG